MRSVPHGLLLFILAVSLARAGVDDETAGRALTERPAAEALAAALLATKSEGERRALLESEKAQVTPDLCQALAAEAMRLHRKGDRQRAVEVYGWVRGIYERLGDRSGIAHADVSIANLYHDQGNYRLALEHQQKALALFEALGDRVGIAAALHNSGNAHLNLGSYPEALAYFQKSLAIREQLADRAGMATLWISISATQRSQGDFDLALASCQKARALYETIGDRLGLAKSVLTIGNIHMDQHNYAPALEAYETALTQFEASGDVRSTAVALSNIGSIHTEQNRPAVGREYLQKALAQFEKLGDQAAIAQILAGIGTTHRLEGNHKLALEYLQESLAQTEAIGDRLGVTFALSNIASVYREQGDLARALEYHQKSLSLKQAIGDKPGIAYSLTSIGSLRSEMGNHAEALGYYQKALELAELLGIADTTFRCYWGVGHAQKALGRTEEAIAAYQKAIAVAEHMRVRVAGGEIERQSFFERRVAPYHALVDLLVSQSRADAALAYAEQAKARALLDVLQSGRVSITKAMTPQESAREQELNDAIASLNARIQRERRRSQPDQTLLDDLESQRSKAQLGYDAFRTRLYATHPSLQAQRGEARLVKLAEARALLPSRHGALIEFVVAREKIFLFVLTRGQDLRVYRLELPRTDLEQRVRKFRELLAQRDPRFRPAARDLYDRLLGPVSSQLKGKTTVILVPDGVLWELPFQALLTPQNRYLVETCALSYAPSWTVLREMRRERSTLNGSRKGLRPPSSVERRAFGTASPAATTSLLAVGNPALGPETIRRVRLAYRDARLQPLPDAEREVRTLARLYGPGQSRIYIGPDAREERVKAAAGTARVLHFATHGILDNRSPLYSQIVLAQGAPSARLGARGSERGVKTDPFHSEPRAPRSELRAAASNTEDGLLEAREILQMDLRAELAVLSACETARGRVGAGEGVIGMTWAFFVAGCPTTVASLWKVESHSTAQLMVAFHRQLQAIPGKKKARSGKAQALRQAQLSLLRSVSHRHPFYWAGFVLVGDGS